MKRKVIVVGGGFGGLATAIRLVKQNFDVELFEQRDKLGGRGYGYNINGFQFDGGPSTITAPFMFDELFMNTGHDRSDFFKLVPVHPFYRFFGQNGRTFDLSADADQMLAQIEKIQPADQSGYLEFLKASQKIFQKGFYELSVQSFASLFDSFKVIPDLVRLRSGQPVYSFVSHYLQDNFLRQVFSYHPLRLGGNPFTTTSLLLLNQVMEREYGIFHALGGTSTIVDGLGQLLEALGGRVRLNAGVSEILVEGRKAVGVRLSDGSIHRSDLVVSDADIVSTYQKLLTTRRRRAFSIRRPGRFKPGISLFVIFLGTRRRYLESGLAHHNIIFGEHYRDFMHDIFERKHLSDDFLLSVDIPTLTDPNLAPEGCEALRVVAPVPNLESNANWASLARPYRDRILSFLQENYLPDLQANLITEHYIDPLHFQNALSSYQGAAYSPAPIFSLSFWSRPRHRLQEVDNLYLTGAGTHPGPGVPGVLSSAKIVEQLVLERYN